MTKRQYAENHQIDEKTGFIENPAYPYAFDAEKKTIFLRAYMENGLDIYSTCDRIGVTRSTVIKHYHQDPAFKEQFDAIEHEYASRLEGISKINAMNPKSVVERLFNLNSLCRKGLTMGKYLDEKNSAPQNIVINIDSQLLSEMKKRDAIIEAEIIKEVEARNPTPSVTPENGLQSTI